MYGNEYYLNDGEDVESGLYDVWYGTGENGIRFDDGDYPLNEDDLIANYREEN